MGYPPIPWLGIMLVGFAFGKIWVAAGRERSKICFRTGLAAILLFLLIRGINGYGDGVAWSAQQDSTYTLLSFLNVTKYPPSLDFTLLFLGLMLVLLAYLEGMQNRFTAVAAVFGKVPLFYFIVHFYLIHILVFLMLFLQGFGVSDMVFGFNFGRPMTGSGLSLWAVYLVWISVVALMYPLCKWYGNYKAAHKSATWLRYL
jgi:uncharacterized membrane protein